MNITHVGHKQHTQNTNTHSHSHSHNHAQGMAKRTLRLAFFLTMIILVAELTGGLLANSLALLSDAGHVVTDIFALGLAWFATAQAERPANARKTFGYHRVGILAALVNAITLILIATAIIWEAVLRLQHPEPTQPLVMFISAGIGIAVNLFIGFGLQKENANLNVRAATLHVFGDVGASVGVIVAALIILLTGWTIADPILSVGIAVLIAVGAWRILRETADILLESVPAAISLPALVRDMRAIKGVRDVHDLHVWSITSEMYALSCHALIYDVPTSKSSAMLQSLNTMLADKYHIGHTTIQFECDDHKDSCCEIRGLYCSMEASVDKCNSQTSSHAHTDDEYTEEQSHAQTPIPVSAKKEAHKNRNVKESKRA
ncbi:MAG TPA: cation diffusion facilitator family transporter [Ktedonobacteraceae bacterium]|nr:cation diffusion facilitator family transporter [Ktedonobacteraceae bacterium]